MVRLLQKSSMAPIRNKHDPNGGPPCIQNLLCARFLIVFYVYAAMSNKTSVVYYVFTYQQHFSRRHNPYMFVYRLQILICRHWYQTLCKHSETRLNSNQITSLSFWTNPISLMVWMRSSVLNHIR